MAMQRMCGANPSSGVRYQAAKPTARRALVTFWIAVVPSP